MDRRQQKTRKAIFAAFSRLLEHKRFENITVQEIIDEADIGRSTFYAHFNTKDELLRAMCTDIFTHIFSDNPISEKTHDFSTGGQTLRDRLTHLLYHLKDNERNITVILSSESGALFMTFFKEYLSGLFDENVTSHPDVPTDFIRHHLVGSFAETVKWWIAKNMEATPEEVAGYYMAVFPK